MQDNCLLYPVYLMFCTTFKSFKGMVFMLNEIRKIKEIEIKNKDKYHIMLVANVREKTTGFKDYNGTSVISEFLTLNQYELIIKTLRNCGFEVSSYFDENDFLKDCITNGFYKNEGKQIIVINTAQKGTAVGRKSLIPAFCDQNGLWHTNSNAYIVSLTRNKYHCDSILQANDFSVTKGYLYYPTSGWFLNKRPQLGEKVIAKLNGETSSIGLNNENIFNYESEKDVFIKELSNTYNQPVLVQTFVEGYEVEVPVVIEGDIIEVVLPVGISVNNKKQLDNTILDYETRKNLRFDFYNFQELFPGISKELEKCTIECVKLLGIEGFGRVDFRIDLSGNYYITDVAANPHLTKGMSFNYAFQENGMEYPEMLEALLATTISRYKRRLK